MLYQVPTVGRGKTPFTCASEGSYKKKENMIHKNTEFQDMINWLKIYVLNLWLKEMSEE